MTDLPIQFEQPLGLWLLLLIPFIVVHGWVYLTGQGPVRRAFVVGVRALVIALLALTIAQPKWLKRTEAVTVVLLLDRSRSISPELENASLTYLAEALKNSSKEDVDRLAIINIGADAQVQSMPDRLALFDPGIPIVDLDATNLAAGLRLGMAIAPRDTAVRFVLASDGNETTDNVLTVADIARANGIPVDVLILEYEHRREVIADRLQAPPQARQGQPVNLKLVLRATHPMDGTITVWRSGQIVDLDETSDATGVRTHLNEGVNTHSLTLTLDDPGVHRFRAEFTPDPPAVEGAEPTDSIASNNRAEAVVVVGGQGRVLILSDTAEEVAALERALRDAKIDVLVDSPSSISDDLILLTAYDTIILADVPAHAFNTRVQETLRRYVYDVGGGLIMLGGPDSFGAGGWIDTPVAKTLPLRLDPPETSQMPRGALVCIMHSSEMPGGNYTGMQCAIAAISALSRLDYAGVLDFDWNAGNDPSAGHWVFPLQEVGDKAAAIAAVKSMQMGDMPDFSPSMVTALNALKSVKAGQKHVIIVSDGDPSPPSAALLQDYVKNKVTVSTVIAGGHGNPGDDQRMKWIADTTGGTFYPQNRAGDMPKIFIKEAMIVRRSLIVEGERYVPVHRPTAKPGPFKGLWSSLPTLDGYVLAVPRPGHDPEILTSTGDPLFAFWQYGLGKSVAFTSDASTRWASSWTGWAGFQGFWEQTVRWSMRAAAPSNLLVSQRLEGNLAIVEMEALTPEGQFANFGRVNAVVIPPSMDAQTLHLQQTGPGRWRGEFRVDQQGSWVVNILREDPDGQRNSVQTALSVPYSPEYTLIKDNRPLLDRLARSTGGRILPSDPRAQDLYDRTNLEIPRSQSDLWQLVAIIACTMFLLDVATRRLAIAPGSVSRFFRTITLRRDSTAGAGMDRLKGARGDVRDRLGRAATPAERAASTTSVIEDTAPIDLAPDSSREVAGTRFEAGPDAAGAPIDLEAGASDEPDRRRPDRPGSASPPDRAADEAPQEGGDHTSRLLKAKRRAQHQSSDDPDQKMKDAPDADAS